MTFSPKKTAALVLLAVLIWQLVATATFAATEWIQNDWTGGPGQTSWSDTTRFSASTNIDYSFPGAIQLEEEAPADWYNPDWPYRNEITVDPDQVPGTDPLIDYPLLVVLDPLDAEADFVNNVQDDAADIVFTAADGVTELNYEIESLDEGTGAFYAWVSIPSLSATDPTSIYVYYGNPDGSLTPGNNVEDVWTNYGLVMHLNQESGQFLDSTANNNDATTSTVEARITGQVNGAAEFSSTNGQLIIPDNPNTSLDVITDFTLSMWINADPDWPGAFKMMMMKSADSSPRNFAWYLNFDTLYLSWFNGGFQEFSGQQVPFGSWELITYRRTGSIAEENLTEQYYINGVLVNNRVDTVPESTLLSDDQNLYIGRQPSGNPYVGLMDEVRISTSAFTPEYIQAEYNNQSDPSSFAIWGPEEEYEPVYASSGSLTSSIFDATEASTWGAYQVIMTISPDTSVAIKARTGNDANLADAPAFGSCDPLTGGEMTSSSCVQDGDRYVQYQLLLSTSDNTESPSVQEVSLSYTTIPHPTPTPTPTPSPTPSPTPAPPTPGGGSFSAPGPASPPGCSDQTPVGQADLFQINRTGSSAQLFFTPVNDNTANYHVMYGFDMGQPLFGMLSAPVTPTTNNGVQSIAINDLDPRAGYWFVIAPVNGCAVGTWSNWFQVQPIGRGAIFYRYLPATVTNIF